MTIRIGIDFGTTYSFIGFKNGDNVMPLIPSKETYGIPSVFYYDGKNKLVGRKAETRAMKHPEYAVKSIKRKMKREKVFRLGEGEEIEQFTSSQIVTEIISYLVECAEEQLTQAFLEEYDEIEAVITVPVDYSEPMKNLIRNAASRVTLRNGSKLHITGVIPEPIAAAIQYFDIRGDEKSQILVYDLGGGTFDLAIVESYGKNRDIPYKVVDQEGDHELGGDDWDLALARWIEEQYEVESGEKATSKLKEEFLLIARNVKQELTELDTVNFDVQVKGEYWELEINRTKFDELTKSLLQRTEQKLRKLIARQEVNKIKYVILTGGSTYMPQIRKSIENSRLFGENTDILLLDPEHAIAYGAARYASTLIWNEGEINREREFIELKATHNYGIAYYQKDKKNKKIEILISKGDKLPVSVSKESFTMEENQKYSNFEVYEIGDTEGKKVVELSKGTMIMDVTITRRLKQDEIIPIGTKTLSVLTLTEQGILTINSKDQRSGEQAQNSVSVYREG